MQILFAALLAMSITIILIPYLMRTAEFYGFIDKPDTRKVHLVPIPRVGGIAIGLATLLATLFWVEFTVQFQVIVLSMFILWSFGLLDDRFNLSASHKFIGQIIAALLVVYWGGVSIERFFFHEYIFLPKWMSVFFTLFVIVGSTNAFNLADGLDGLAGGSALICLSGILLLALLGQSMQIALLSAIVMGAILGFLRFNTYPAQVFMGDSGSQLLGFTIVVLAILLTQDPHLPYSESLPFVLLGVPVIDTLMVMFGRIWKKQSPFKADRNHIHHRLLDMGLYHHEAVMMIYVFQLCMVIIGWALRYHSDFIIISVFICVLCFIVISLYFSRKTGFHFRAKKNTRINHSYLYSLLMSLKHDQGHAALIDRLIGIAVGSYFLLLIINNSVPDIDVSMLAVFIGIVWVIVALLGEKYSFYTNWVGRAVLYVTVMTAVTVDRTGMIPREVKFFLEALIFISMAVPIGLRIYVSENRRFDASPLDFLVLLVTLILPNLPGNQLSAYVGGWFVVKVLLMFYAVEALNDSKHVSNKIKNAVELCFLCWLSLGLVF